MPTNGLEPSAMSFSTISGLESRAPNTNKNKEAHCTSFKVFPSISLERIPAITILTFPKTWKKAGLM